MFSSDYSELIFKGVCLCFYMGGYLRKQAKRKMHIEYVASNCQRSSVEWCSSAVLNKV